MKILHTSDWHLGKNLDVQSRIDEQEKFINELEEIANEEDIDLIIVAGDIYDTSNPSSAAEKLFFKSLKSLSNNGKRPILIIAGNHDSPDRLIAATPILQDMGIIIVGTLKTVIPVGDYNSYKIINSGEGFIEIEINNEKAIILLMPFPSETRLKEVISYKMDEENIQKDYSYKVKKILHMLSENFREDTINLIVGHFFVIGAETSDSERNIQLGGSMAISADAFPKNAHYIAMGHLHRPQQIKGTIEHAYYSGSPIQYSKSEANYAKLVYIVDLDNSGVKEVKKRFLKNYKPIEVWKVKNINDAIEQCKNNSDRECWVFLEIDSDKALEKTDMVNIRNIKKDILEINVNWIDKAIEEEVDIYKDRTIEEEFVEFYKKIKNIEPNQDTLDLFFDLITSNDEKGEDI